MNQKIIDALLIVLFIAFFLGLLWFLFTHLPA